MALNLTSRLQVTAHYFWNRRNAAALSHHGVRLAYDPEQRRMTALVLGGFLTIVMIGLAALMAFIKPAGQVGKSQILADRDTGAIYVMVDNRLHPALNLISARLISGEDANPTFVKAAELAKYPQGPMVGIVGAPTQMPVRTGLESQWAVCDSAPSATATKSAGQTPVVTAIAGPLAGRRSAPLTMPNAVLARHDDKTIVIWDGHRSEIDVTNKSVALALGVDSSAPPPVPMSTAVYDAIPATDPLIIPAIPNAGQPSPWDLGRPAPIGSVLSVHDVQQSGDELFVLLPNGVQHISPFVASLLRSANSFGDLGPVVVSPDRLAAVPVVESLPVSYYPPTRLHLVDTSINGTTCLAWSKGSTDKAAKVTVLSGQGLPTAPESDDRLVHLVKDARTTGAGVEADQVYIAPSATNLVMTTNADPVSVSRDSLWWVSDQGVRYGIELNDSALKPLHITTASARQAPWVLIRTFAPGPALSRTDALTQHDTLEPVAGAETLPTKTP